MKSAKLSYPKKRIEWVNLLFLVISPLIAICGTIFLVHYHAVRVPTVIFMVIFGAGSGIAVTAGYHRLFAHRSYEAKWPVRLFMLLLGAAAFENSVREWASDHRDHHKFVDTDLDPYNIKNGFWYAHIGWIFFKRETTNRTNIADLDKDPLVGFQDRHYLLIAILVGFAIPMAVCGLWHDALGGLLLGGFARVVLNHHFTFSINSFCHYIGAQPYSDKNSSRDSWIPALFTYGEGYHNYHHTFPSDYRNGILNHQWDPTKWLIRALEWIGQTYDLRRISDSKILEVRLRMDEKRLLQKLDRSAEPHRGREFVAVTRQKLEAAHLRFQTLKAEYLKLKKEKATSLDAKWATFNKRLETLKSDLYQARESLKRAFADWGRVCAVSGSSASF